jgi:hypothetical protein
MKKYWFKQKQTGYGFVPTTWEGWASTVITLVLIFIIGRVNNLFTATMTGDDVFQFLVDFVILTVLFIIFIRNRVEGGFKWKKNEKEK